MSSRRLKCCVAMVVFCVGVGWIFGYGLALGVDCNTKRLLAKTHCDADYDELTYCSHRGGQSTCESQPGAEGDTVGGSGEEWSPGCNDGVGVNSDHCELEEPDGNCLQKYNCCYNTETGGCWAGSAYKPDGVDTYYQSDKARSPSCTPAE